MQVHDDSFHATRLRRIVGDVVAQQVAKGWTAARASALGQGLTRLFELRYVSIYDATHLAHVVLTRKWRPLAAADPVNAWVKILEALLDDAIPGQLDLEFDAATIEEAPDHVVGYCATCRRPVWESDGGDCPDCGGDVTISQPKDELPPTRGPVAGIVATCQKCRGPIFESSGAICPRCDASWYSPSN